MEKDISIVQKITFLKEIISFCDLIKRVATEKTAKTKKQSMSGSGVLDLNSFIQKMVVAELRHQTKINNYFESGDYYEFQEQLIDESNNRFESFLHAVSKHFSALEVRLKDLKEKNSDEGILLNINERLAKLKGIQISIKSAQILMQKNLSQEEKKEHYLMNCERGAKLASSFSYLFRKNPAVAFELDCPIIFN